MCTPDRLPVQLTPRAAPLVPEAVLAHGAVVARLAARLAALPDERLRRLAGASGDGWLVAVGDAAALPWVDGVVYLGRDPRAPDLFLPTTASPSVPIDVFARALEAAHSTLARPLALSVTPAAVFSLAAARPIDRARLEHLLEGS